MRSFALSILAVCIAVPGVGAQTKGDTIAVLRIIASVYRRAGWRITALADTGSAPASRATLAAILNVPLRAATDSTFPTCSWVAAREKQPRGVEATLERFELNGNDGQALVSVTCAQPGAGISDEYWMGREFRFRKVRGRWRAMPGGRIQVTQAGLLDRCGCPPPPKHSVSRLDSNRVAGSLVRSTRWPTSREQIRFTLPRLPLVADSLRDQKGGGRAENAEIQEA
jgi:hypothetical protein